MKNLLLVVPAMFLLTACGAPSVEELAGDPKLLQETAAECSTMKHSEVAEDEACLNVQKAILKVSKQQMGNLMGNMNNTFK